MEMRRRQKEEYFRRKEQERQEELLRQKRAKATRQARANAFKKYTKAATVIQSAYRTYLERKEKRAKNEAALVIAKFMKRVAGFVEGKKVLKSLTQLNQVRLSLEEISNEYKSNPFGYRKNLLIADQTEKKILSLDAIDTRQLPFIRAARKIVVLGGQETLRFADVVLKTLNRKAAIIQAWWTQRNNVEKSEKMESAARVVTKVIRAIPKVKSARLEAEAMRVVREQKRELEQLRQEYGRKLRKLMGEIDRVRCSTESVDVLRKRIKSDAKMDLQGLLRVQNKRLRGVSSI